MIGAYEGAKYHEYGLYRPSVDSKMRSLGDPFNAICREKIILDIYGLVDPFDSWLDNSQSLLDPSQLSVARIDDEVIAMEWFVDGQLIAGADGSTFSLNDFGYGPGEYQVSARGFDPTGFDPVNGWVRMDQGNLEQFVSWNVIRTVPEPASLMLWGLCGGLAAMFVSRRRRPWRPLATV